MEGGFDFKGRKRARDEAAAAGRRWEKSQSTLARAPPAPLSFNPCTLWKNTYVTNTQRVCIH